MNRLKTYSIMKFPNSRIFTTDIGVLGSRKHHIKALVEFDVTGALEKIRLAKSRGTEAISFTSWILKCIAISLDNHKQAHALRQGRRKLVLFDDVDISIMVEKTIDNQRVPIPHVLRAVNRKTIAQIHEEIDQVKKADPGDKKLNIDRSNTISASLFLHVPQFLRLLLWKIILRNPMRVKKIMGTSLLTSVGMFGPVPGWAIPYSIHPISFTLGSITKKAAAADTSILNRDILHMTVLIDHDVIDGAPAARFMAHLNELIERGHGL